MLLCAQELAGCLVHVMGTCNALFMCCRFEVFYTWQASMLNQHQCASDHGSSLTFQ